MILEFLEILALGSLGLLAFAFVTGIFLIWAALILLHPIIGLSLLAFVLCIIFGIGIKMAMAESH